MDLRSGHRLASDDSVSRGTLKETTASGTRTRVGIHQSAVSAVPKKVSGPSRTTRWCSPESPLPSFSPFFLPFFFLFFLSPLRFSRPIRHAAHRHDTRSTPSFFFFGFDCPPDLVSHYLSPPARRRASLAFLLSHCGGLGLLSAFCSSPESSCPPLPSPLESFSPSHPGDHSPHHCSGVGLRRNGV